MSKVTAEFYRSRPVFVEQRGGGEIECRCPDPLDLIANGVLPLEVYSRVLEVLAEWADRNTGPNLNAETTLDPVAWVDFMDRWAMAAAVSPRLVKTIEEADGDDLVWIGDLDSADKMAIYVATNRRIKHAARLGDALKEFRRLRPESVATGSDGEAVRVETVGAAAGA